MRTDDTQPDHPEPEASELGATAPEPACVSASACGQDRDFREPLSPERLASLRRWIEEREYDAPHVRDAVAEKIFGSGEL